MLQLRIVSPEKVEYDGEVLSVVVPGTMGQFEILNDHAPIISTLQKGVVEYTTQDAKANLEILGGFVEVQKNVVSLCVELSAGETVQE
ncbi:MAG: ATP synthase F1 subunit epsilon [Prevotella sp.]|nr:ATP synthase F1 subunit epsilon [Prevotella sp.]